jgi:hypothetical protein
MTRFDYTHPFERQYLLFRTWPFLVAMLLGWALLPLTANHSEPGLLVVAAVLNLTIVLAVYLLPWDRIGYGAAVPALAWLAVVMLMRHATGGSAAGYSPLVLLTILWAALYGSRWVLAIAVVGAVAAIAVPPIVWSVDLYPDTEVRRALMYGVVGTLIGFAIHETVAGLQAERAGRRRAEDALTRQRAFELNDDVVQDLAVAKLSLQTGRTEEGLAALDRALASGKRIISDMVEQSGRFERFTPTESDE